MSLPLHKSNLLRILICLVSLLLSCTAALADKNKDFIMVSLGDSYASGEGAPNSPATANQGAVWNDVSPCHRSDNAPALLAFTKLKADHPGISFAVDGTGRLLHLACSGAGVVDGLLGPQREKGVLRSQIEMVKMWMDANYPEARYPLRKIDALIIDIGGNDAYFEPIAASCLVPALPVPGDPDLYDCSKLATVFSDGMRELTKPDGRYHKLVDQILTQLPYVANVYITEYPDPTHDAAGRLCDARPLPDFGGFTRAEARWASNTVIPALNQAITNLVADGNRRSSKTTWNMVTGISSQFATHGICADANYVRGRPRNRFFNTIGDSLLVQSGNTCDVPTALTRFFGLAGRSSISDQLNLLTQIFPSECDHHGAVHPNPSGYLAYRAPIVTSISPQFDRPAAPANLKRDLMTQERIDIHWSDKSVNEDVFEIRYHTSTNNTWKEDTLPWGSTHWTLNGLTPGDTYRLELRSCSYVLPPSLSCSDWMNLTIVHQPPAAPTNARLGRVGPRGPRGKDVLRWNDNSNNEEAFEVQVMNGDVWNSTIRVRANATQTGTDIVGGDAYRVRACISQLCSDWSNVAHW